MADRWRAPLENFARSRGPKRPRRRYPEPLCHPEKVTLNILENLSN